MSELAESLRVLQIGPALQLPLGAAHRKMVPAMMSQISLLSSSAVWGGSGGAICS